MASLSFKNEDYNYLINNNELIMTCREALAENLSINKSSESVNLEFLSYTSSSSSSSTSSSTPPSSSSSSSHRETTSGDSPSLPVGVLNAPKPNSDKVSLREFSKWITRTEDHLNSVCYCSFHPENVNSNSSNPIKSTNINNIIHSDWIAIIAELKVIQTEIQSVGRRFINSLKANAIKIDQSLLTVEEDRWHVLWLKSIEYSMLVEEFNFCPNHTTWNRERSSPHSNSKRFRLASFSEGKENIKAMMRNRRIQTNMIGIGAGPGLNETYNLPSGKFEIIHKDIGYSSDADMSDACEPGSSSCPNYVNANAKSPRKRRRRRPRIGERPWSFHSEWTGWDYYQPPLGYGGEYRSSEDLKDSFEDENLVRSLTEFGENYERWFKPDDGILPEKHKILTSSPKVNCPSLTGAETTDSFDFTSESLTNSGANIEVTPSAQPAVAPTFTINNDDTDADADVITHDLVPFPVIVKAPTPLNPYHHPPPPSTNIFNSTSTQTYLQQLTSSKSTTTTKTTTTTPTTSTKYFFIYLTITFLMAVILSILVASLSPISPHVQKSYPNQSPPN